jgi:hypothetical protein
MKKIFKNLGFGVFLGIMAVVLVLGAGSASANLTLGALNIVSSGALTLTSTSAALNITSGGALTLEGAAASVITLGALNTGGINVGNGNTAKTINIGSGNAANTINIGYYVPEGEDEPPINVVNIGNYNTSTVMRGVLIPDGSGYSLYFDGDTTGDDIATVFYMEDPVSSNAEITFPASNGTVSLVDKEETLLYKTLTSPTLNSPTMTTPSLGAATASSLTIGVGTIDNLSIGSLTDGTSGWVPDGIVTSFTITASIGDIGANTLISVSLGANANLTTCSVSTRTAGTNFVVNCSAAPANGATLQYMMVNDFFGDA